MDDLLIIGGSAAGTAAAIYAARRGLKARVLAKDLGGEVALSGEIENFPGMIHTTGVELAGAFEKHLKSYQLPVEVGIVVGAVEKEGSGFTVTATKDGRAASYQAKAVIIATGVHPRLLKVPGEKEFKNKGVSYCTVCDGPLFKGKKVITVGGANSALESALMLSGIAETVTVLTINPQMEGEAILIQKVTGAPNVTIIPNAQTLKITGNQVVTGLEYKDTATGQTRIVAAQGIFIHVGMIPNSDFVSIAEKNEFGEIKVNQLGETSVPGLLAAGDVTDHPFKQIAIAVGHGVTAALQAVRYLDNFRG